MMEGSFNFVKFGFLKLSRRSKRPKEKKMKGQSLF